jgi:enoyl-CoA hydratase/carnithine racemase
MSYESITYEQDERLAIITLNLPKRLNALSRRLCAEVSEAVKRADADPLVRIVIVTGAGERAFSVGYDIADGDEGMQQSVDGCWGNLNFDYDFAFSVWNCSKPVIAMIDGYCLAGGLELALMCDIRYCSERSTFGVVESRFAAGSAALAMPWIIGQHSRELIYSGKTIDAAAAYRMGLVNEVFSESEIRTEAIRRSKGMSQVALACLQYNKRALNGTMEAMGFHAAMRYGVSMTTLMHSTKTPEFEEFDAIRREQGFKAALKWRDAQFAPYED